MIDTQVEREVRAAREAARTCVFATPPFADLGERISAPRQVALHPSWAELGALPPPLRERLGVSDADVVAAATQAIGAGRWSELLAVTNASSYGASPDGAWRTARILALPGVEERLEDAVTVLEGSGPVAAYYHLANEGHLRGWGPEHFTRFLAAVDQRRPERAVVLSPAGAAGLNALVGTEAIAAQDWPTVDYAFHHALTHRIAATCGWPVAVVENALEASSPPLGKP